MTRRLAINPIACTGHGLCADTLPELIQLDEWGYPIMPDHPVPDHLAALARRAVRLCPTLALRLEPVRP
jgi:ferredoxin